MTIVVLWKSVRIFVIKFSEKRQSGNGGIKLFADTRDAQIGLFTNSIHRDNITGWPASNPSLALHEIPRVRFGLRVARIFRSTRTTVAGIITFILQTHVRASKNGLTDMKNIYSNFLGRAIHWTLRVFVSCVRQSI